MHSVPIVQEGGIDMIAKRSRGRAGVVALAAALASAVAVTGREHEDAGGAELEGSVAQCPGGFCPAPWNGGTGGDAYQVTPRPEPPEESTPFDKRFHMVVRVKAALGHIAYAGTGVIVGADGTRAWVLTAYHTFRNGGTPKVIVYDGRSFLAVIAEKDEEADLARLVIADPGIAPIEMEDAAPLRGEELQAMGFDGGGGTENFKVFCGKLTQYVTADRLQKYDLLELACAARAGDSGGPIINSRGRLVGIIRGSDGRCCSGPCLPRLRGMVRWLVPGQAGPPQSPGPLTPGARAQGPPPASPLPPPAPTPPGTDPAIKRLEARVATLEARVTMLEAVSRTPGPPGKDGRDGTDGLPGPPAVVDYERLAADIAKRIAPDQPDYDRITAEVAKRLPPITVQTLKAGKVLAEEKVPLGGVLPLNLVPVKAQK
jgi:hypothetical protein